MCAVGFPTWRKPGQGFGSHKESGSVTEWSPYSQKLLGMNDVLRGYKQKIFQEFSSFSGMVFYFGYS